MRGLIIASLLLAACQGETPGEDSAEPEVPDATAEAPAAPELPPLPPLPDTPADVAAAPEDAKKTDSGLAYKVIEAGTGTEHPTAKSLVTVHYTGWTTDGKMFDSSIKRGRTAKFGLSQVIPGWTEGLQLMTVGETTRFWIPKEIAYNGAPNKPEGMLVFDVVLMDFESPPADLTSPPADGKKTEGGVTVKTLRAGTGTEHPTDEATVEVHFTGWTADGDLLQTTEGMPRPAKFNIETAIPGWREGLKLMVVGERARMWVPEEMAKVPGAPPGDVVFDFELIKIEMPIPAPDDVSAPPADAQKTESGLAYKVLKAGTGATKPTAASSVKVHYTGWTASDGKMFDSSVMGGEPMTLPILRVIPGWQEGLQLMVEGEKTRFWIPAELAYAGKPNGPQGMLVFDVELFEIMAAPAPPPGMPGMPPAHPGGN